MNLLNIYPAINALSVDPAPPTGHTPPLPCSSVPGACVAGDSGRRRRGPTPPAPHPTLRARARPRRARARPRGGRYVYTRDLGRGWRVAEGLEYGMVGLNEGAISTEVGGGG